MLFNKMILLDKDTRNISPEIDAPPSGYMAKGFSRL